MYGKSGTIGLIVPSNNTVVEREFNSLLPEDFNVVAARMYNTKTTPEQLALMEQGSIDAATLLSDAHPDVIAFACTSGSFLNGPEYEANLRKQISEAGGATAITTSQAFLAAFRALGVKKIAVATPYPDDVNEKERDFIEASGYEITNLLGLNIQTSYEIGKCSTAQAADIARESDSDEAEAVFISCTNFATFDQLKKLEDELGKPVLSSNLATYWYAMRTMGVTGVLGDTGLKLLALPVPENG